MVFIRIMYLCWLLAISAITKRSLACQPTWLKGIIRCYTICQRHLIIIISPPIDISGLPTAITCLYLRRQPKTTKNAIMWKRYSWLWPTRSMQISCFSNPKTMVDPPKQLSFELKSLQSWIMMIPGRVVFDFAVIILIILLELSYSIFRATNWSSSLQPLPH